MVRKTILGNIMKRKIRNFSHSYSRAEKLIGALRVAKRLIEDGVGIGNDSEFGNALVSAGIRGFRESTPKENRRPDRTARDLRNLFCDIGFIEGERNESLELTETGNKILDCKNSDDENDIWHSSLMSLKLEDNDIAIRPYEIIVKLVVNFPGIELEKLCLAFACENDNDEEFEYIQGFVHMDIDEIIEKFDATPEIVNNVTSTLPSLGKQIGDFQIFDRLVFPSEMLMWKYQQEYLLHNDIYNILLSNRETKNVTSNEIAMIPNYSKFQDDITSTYSSAGQKIIKKRMANHQNLVKKFANYLEERGFQLYEYPFDCLAVKENTNLLLEAKTITDTIRDQRKQTERAIGQILGYLQFNLPDNVNKNSAILIILFEKKPNIKIFEYFELIDIIPVWYSENDDSFMMCCNGEKQPFSICKLV